MIVLSVETESNTLALKLQARKGSMGVCRSGTHAQCFGQKDNVTMNLN